MSGVNKAIIVGHLGRDPELRRTNSGQSVASFSVATSKSWTDKQGQKQERTEWHRIVVWGKTAELCGKYLAKGRLVAVEGELSTRKYQDRDGNERTSTEIIAREVTFLGSGNGKQTAQQQSQDEEPWPRQSPSSDEEVPF